MTIVFIDAVNKSDAKKLVEWWNANTPYYHFIGKYPYYHWRNARKKCHFQVLRQL